MSDFESKIFSATQEQPGTDYDAYKELLKRQAEAAKKQFGSIYDKGLTTPTNEAAMLKSDRAAASGEFARREAGGQAKYDLARSVDTRKTELGNRVRAALAGRSNLEQDVAQKQFEQNAGYKQSLAEAQQQYEDERNKLDFSKQKSAADREDAMTKALEEGTLFSIMQQATEQGATNMGDIDRYFAVLNADFKNKLQDLSVGNKITQDAFINDFNNTAAKNSQIISGIASVGNAGFQAYTDSKKAAAAKLEQENKDAAASTAGATTRELPASLGNTVLNS